MAPKYGGLIMLVYLLPLIHVTVNQEGRCADVDPKRYDMVTSPSPSTEIFLICESHERIIKLWKCTNGTRQQILTCDRHINGRRINCSVTVNTQEMFYCTSAGIGEDDVPYKYFNVTVQTSIEPEIILPDNLTASTTSETPTSVETSMTSTILDVDTTEISMSTEVSTTEAGIKVPPGGNGNSTTTIVAVTVVTCAVLVLTIFILFPLIVFVVVLRKRASSGDNKPEGERPPESRTIDGASNGVSDQERRSKGENSAQQEEQQHYEGAQNEMVQRGEGFFKTKEYLDNFERISDYVYAEVCSEDTWHSNTELQMISPKSRFIQTDPQNSIEVQDTHTSYTYVYLPHFKVCDMQEMECAKVRPCDSSLLLQGHYVFGNKQLLPCSSEVTEVPECPEQLSFSDYDLETHLSQVETDLSKTSLILDDGTYTTDCKLGCILSSGQVTKRESEQDDMTRPSSPRVLQTVSDNIEQISGSIEDELLASSEDSIDLCTADFDTETETSFLDAIQSCNESTSTVPVVSSTRHHRTPRHHNYRRTIETDLKQLGPLLLDPNGVVFGSTQNVETGNANNSKDVLKLCIDQDYPDGGKQPIPETGRSPNTPKQDSTGSAAVPNYCDSGLGNTRNTCRTTTQDLTTSNWSKCESTPKMSSTTTFTRCIPINLLTILIPQVYT